MISSGWMHAACRFLLLGGWVAMSSLGCGGQSTQEICDNSCAQQASCSELDSGETEASCAAECTSAAAEMSSGCRKSFLDALKCQAELSCDSDGLECLEEVMKLLTDCSDEMGNGSDVSG